MANETVGELVCPFCNEQAAVRLNAKNKLYFVCFQDGITQPTKPNFQEWIKEHATMYGTAGVNHAGGGEPEETKQEEAPKEKQTEVQTEIEKPEEKTIKTSNDLDEWMR